jgi:alcohol dehydrogenase class IV
VVGGRYGLQHGISHSILLAPAMRRLLPAIGDDQRYVLAAMTETPEAVGPDTAGARAADLLQAMFETLPLPRRLGDVGVKADEIAGIAAATMGDYMMAYLPRPVAQDEVEDLLREAL